MRICAVEGCGLLYFSNGLCKRHHEYWRKGGDPHVRRNCRFCGALMPVTARPDQNFCDRRCQMKWHRRKGCYTDAALKQNRGVCSVAGCGKAVQSRGLCHRHKMRLWRHGDANAEVMWDRQPGPHDKNASAARRRALKLHATPLWMTRADWKEIEAIYRLARKMTKATGVEHHVDHVIPLQSRSVCGLHLAVNMQILTDSDNTRKSNRLLPENLIVLPPAPADDADRLRKLESEAAQRAPYGRTNEGPCSVEGCEKKAHCRGMCAMHYGRWQRHGDLSVHSIDACNCGKRSCPAATKIRQHLHYVNNRAAYIARAAERARTKRT